MDEYRSTNDDQQQEDEIVIHVRDRRKPKQYIVDNLIMDEYYPIIKSSGYSIYSLLVRMSNERSGEQTWASLRMMAAHLGIGSNSTLSYYITLLEITGLIFKDLPEAIVMQGGKKVKKKLGNRSNIYYILDVKPVTPERLEAFKVAVKTNQTFTESYRNLFLKNLDEWQPIQSHWRPKGKKIKTIVGQPGLPFTDEAKEDDAAPSVATIEDANPTSLKILRQLEITKPSLLQELGQQNPAHILALIFYGRTQSWMEDDRISGYVIKNLGPDGAPAPKKFMQVAQYWLSANEEQRQLLADAWPYQGYAHSLSQEYELPLPIAEVALKLTNQDPSKNCFLEWLDL